MGHSLFQYVYYYDGVRKGSVLSPILFKFDIWAFVVKSRYLKCLLDYAKRSFYCPTNAFLKNWQNCFTRGHSAVVI